MKSTLVRLALAGCVSLAVAGQAAAEVKFGVDVMSRYIWRGVDYGNAPSFQPAITLTFGGFSLGTWAAYSFASNAQTPAFAEHDLWAGYTLSTPVGGFSLFYTDYFYPSAGLPYFNFSSNGGAHVLEGGVGYAGPESVPLTFSVYMNFHNDPDNSVYIYAAYPFSIEEYTLTLFAGATPTTSAWYVTTEKAGLINAGITLSRTIKITESFSLPITASYMMNTVLEQSYLVVGVSL